MTVTDAAIPVGGLGTRLLPATRSQPKEMLPVVDRPVVQYVVEELVRAGIARVLFITGRRKRAIEDHFDADPELGEGPLMDPRTGLQLFYARQPRPAGLGDALRYAELFADGRGVAVALGDTIIERRPRPAPAPVDRLIEAFSSSGTAVGGFSLGYLPVYCQGGGFGSPQSVVAKITKTGTFKAKLPNYFAPAQSTQGYLIVTCKFAKGSWSPAR